MSASEAAAAVAGGAAEDGPGAPPAALHGPAAEAARVRPPRQANWGTMTRAERKYLKQHGGKPRCNKNNGGTWVPRGDPPSRYSGLQKSV